MGLEELDDFYSEAILDHCRRPRNPAKLKDPDVSADGVNPFCGDEIHLQIELDAHGHVVQIGLQGVGCSINQATGSMLTEAVRGKGLDEIEAVSEAFGSMMAGHLPDDGGAVELGELENLSSVRQFPVRIKCALLAWDTLQDGIDDYRRSRPNPQSLTPTP